METSDTRSSSTARGGRAVAFIVALLLAGIVDPTAWAQPNPANQCRADNPAAEAILPVVQPQVQKFLGRHPKSTTPGVSLAVVSASQNNPGTASIAIINCGVTAANGTTPTTSDTVYEIGSETKVFTATALAQLSLRGVVQLDNSLQSFLPQPYAAPESPCGSSNQSAITLRELATHNSGLKENPKNQTWSPKNPEGHQNYTRTNLYQSFTAGWQQPCDALLSTPGTKYSYSNWGFALLGTILADRYAPSRTDVPNFAKLVGDLVTGPLGMRSTGLEAIPPTPAMAQPTCTNGVTAPCYWNNVNAFAGGGGLVSTISDMATFTAANLGFGKQPSIWPALQSTHNGQGLGPDCGTCEGLGWMITPPGDPGSLSSFQMLSKDGGTWGMFSHTYLLPDACWGITFLSNSDQSFPVSTSGGFAGPIISTLAPKQPCPGGPAR
ncbi:MAG: serine hydrolase domain-containing protein [Mycobacterium sp.]